MRWRLCKAFKISVDDVFFKNINKVQYAWYEMQIDKDDDEHYELLRNIAEHNAMFSNPEGVGQVREARKNTFSTNVEDFENSVKELFGRGMDNDAQEVVDLEQAIRQNQKQVNPYLNMELDEISFTPIRGK